MGSGLKGGRRALARKGATPTISAYGLLGGDVNETQPRPEVDVPAELLADLHDPLLVITPEYVGRDRRPPGPAREAPRVVRRAPPQALVPKRHGPSARLGELAAAVLVTVAAVVPLVLIASHAGGPSASPQQVIRSVVAPPSGGGRHPGGHLGSRQSARVHRIRPAGGNGTAGSKRASVACDGSSAAALVPRCARTQAAIDRRAQLAQAALDRRTQRAQAAIDRRTQRAQAASDRRTQRAQAASDRRTQRAAQQAVQAQRHLAAAAPAATAP